MRLLIRLDHAENAFRVPYNHQYSLQGLIYKAILLGDPTVSRALEAKEIPQLFTYSLFMAKERRIVKGSPFFIGYWHGEFTFSTPIEAIGHALAEGLEKLEVARLWGEKFYIDKVKELNEPESFTGKKYSTQSPIAVTVKRKVGGRERTYDLGPDDEGYMNHINRNLLWKLELLGREPVGDGQVEFEILRKRSKRFEVKPGIFQRAWHLVFKAYGDEELLRTGYQAGFGEKNTIGFGLVKYVKK
ncbi:MAG: CRISPR-associated endoribonuclease Cas6 [Thermococcus sp.]